MMEKFGSMSMDLEVVMKLTYYKIILNLDEDPLEDRNYGWPKATYGINYSGSEITKNKKLEGSY